MTTQDTTLTEAPRQPTRLADRPRLRVRSFGLTDPGRVRPDNEDHFLIADLTKALYVQQSSVPQAPSQYSDERGYLLLVADGMGGHRAGGQASALAIGTIEGFVLNTLKWFVHQEGSEQRYLLGDLEKALREADRRIFQETARHPECRGMGTTLTLAYCLGPELFVAHVGDSRCYLLRGGRLKQLTHDHTLVEELVRRGALRPEDAAQHQYRHVITNAVGGHSAGVKVEPHTVDLEADDVVLLCSDGLTEMLPPERIAGILQAEPDPKPACARLVAEANAAGGKDNITVIVARFEAAAGPDGEARPCA
jgi:protein phosphatase